jgi:hypothetical protein
MPGLQATTAKCRSLSSGQHSMANINLESRTRPNKKMAKRQMSRKRSLDTRARTRRLLLPVVSSATRKEIKETSKEYKSEILGKIEGEMNFTRCCQERRLQMRRSHR